MNTNLIPLSKVSSIFNGKTPSKKDQRIEGYPVLKIKDVSDDGLFKDRFQSFVDELFVEKFKNKKVIIGDTLILNAAHNSDYVGSKIYKVENNVAGALATGEWTIVRANKTVLDSQYLYYWFLSGKTRHNIRQIVKGIHLYPKDVERLKIPLPPIAEQRRIASILDKADEIRRKRQEAIKLTEELGRSLFLDMFGDPVTNPKRIKLVKLGDYIEIKGGGTPSRKNDKFWGGNIPWASVKDINGLQLEETQESITEIAIPNSSTNIIPSNTVILVTRMGVGRVTLTTKNTAINQDLKALFCKKQLIPKYLLYCLYCFENIMKANESGATVKGITIEDINNFPLLLPSIELQKKFLILEEKIHEELEINKKSAQESENLFNSLLQRAFKGEV